MIDAAPADAQPAEHYEAMSGKQFLDMVNVHKSYV